MQPQLQLSHALYLIEENAGAVIRVSGVYKTQAWGNEQQDAFYNQVICLKTKLSATALMDKLLAIEAEMGRKRNIKWEPRLIDLDIQLIDNKIIKKPNLVVPHPLLPQRRFALTPLCELVPNLVHPQFNKPLHHLLEVCADPLAVEKLPN